MTERMDANRILNDIEQRERLVNAAIASRSFHVIDLFNRDSDEWICLGCGATGTGPESWHRHSVGAEVDAVLVELVLSNLRRYFEADSDD